MKILATTCRCGHTGTICSEGIAHGLASTIW